MVSFGKKTFIETVHGVKHQLPSEMGRQPSDDKPSSADAPTALIVEDSPTNREVLSRLLRSEGFHVVSACNGQEGVQQFQENSVDIVLMDIEMPIMNGLEATRMIRQLDARDGSHTTIIAITDGVDRETCLQAGLDDHMAKPARANVIHTMLKRHHVADTE